MRQVQTRREDLIGKISFGRQKTKKMCQAEITKGRKTVQGKVQEKRIRFRGLRWALLMKLPQQGWGMPLKTLYAMLATLVLFWE